MELPKAKYFNSIDFRDLTITVTSIDSMQGDPLSKTFYGLIHTPIGDFYLEGDLSEYKFNKCYKVIENNLPDSLVCETEDYTRITFHM